MSDSDKTSASWGDPTAVVDADYNRHSIRNTMATVGILICVVAIGIGLYLWRQNEKKKTAAIEANGELIAQAIVKRVRGTGVPPGFAIRRNDEPLLSWRVDLLPYLEQRALRDEFDLDSAWDSEANLSLSEIVVPCFQSDRGQRKTPSCTNWVAVVGTKTVIRGRRANRNEYASVKNQVAFVELLDSDIPWTQPRDVSVEEAIQLIRSSGEYGGLFCGLGNGGVIRLSADTSEKELKRLLGE